MFAQQPTTFPNCLLALILGVATTTAAWAEPNCNHPEIEKQFIRQFQSINRNIHQRQEALERMLDDIASEEQIKEMTRDLIRWKAKRDTLAIDYILRRRRDDCPQNLDLSPLKSK